MNTNRRTFLKHAGVGLATAYFAPSLLSCSSQQVPASTLQEIGLQLYTLREQLADDVSATLARVAEIGYDYVETFGAEINNGKDTAFWGMDTGNVIKLLDQYGLKTYSGHYDLSELLTPGNGDEEVLKVSIDMAARLQQQYVIAPAPPMLLIDKLTADDYRFMADQLNKGGELAVQSGLKIGYHNHFWEFRTLEGGRKGLDILIENTDKDLVVFELDLFWSEKSGTDSAAYFEKHPGRFPLWHIKDIDKSNTTIVTGPDYDSKPMMEITSSITYTEVGTGIIDFKKILVEEKTAGLQYAIVEQDVITIDPFDSIAKSYDYVKNELLGS
ncbi:sugar phosphate isomerase/epimerase family protein [Parapedobacter koreensis]|uniref:Sugar phosphate isomerase/epimerase n=1 Tax=Parapedobacter koreensis TaxID=332977 RepID=A0A1H7STS7_9SPHI|nr:sugar phosphate isomerase/epimerase [Parapedobacter koreensis]SEL75961.1 Sugar phosphate isomerase/epimerase [Parapedobacter koreensis]